MRGASALESVLQAVADAGVRTFVVWEPVLPTDWGRPSTSALARVPDIRALQLWDPTRRLSQAMGGGTGREDVIWDVVAIYPRGAEWAAGPPPHVFLDGPVVNVIAAFRQKLSSVLAGVPAIR